MTTEMNIILEEIRAHAAELPEFWTTVALSSPGPDGTDGDVDLAKARHTGDWETFKRLTLLHVAAVGGVDDFGRIGTEAEAAVRIRVVLQEADEQALNLALGWPPFIEGTAQAPLDMLTLGFMVAHHLGTCAEPADFTRSFTPHAWVDGLPALVGIDGADPATAEGVDFVAAAADRRRFVCNLDTAVANWVVSGPAISPTPLLWDFLGDSGLERFLVSQGASVWDAPAGITAEMRGAIRQARTIGAPELRMDVQWLCALRLALRGEMAVFAAETMADLRPWGHDNTLTWLRRVLES